MEDSWSWAFIISFFGTIVLVAVGIVLFVYIRNKVRERRDEKYRRESAAREAEADKFRIHCPRCYSTYIDVHNSREFILSQPKIRLSYKKLPIKYKNSDGFSYVNVLLGEAYTEDVRYTTIVCDHCGLEFALEYNENGVQLNSEYVNMDKADLGLW